MEDDMNIELKAILLSLVAASASQFAFAAGVEGESAATREKRTVMANWKMGGFSAGLEIGVLAGDESAYGLALQVDHFYVTGVGVIGPFMRSYHGNSLFTQGTFGYVEEIDLGQATRRGAGGHFLIGNEWSFDSGLVISADWIGVSAGVVRSAEGNSRGYVLPSLPKFGIGLSL
jgi:hypothetical protein